MSNLIKNAQAFATSAHAGQVRRYTSEPYTSHLTGVADLVRTVLHSEEILAAAFLHDTIEDTTVTVDEIRVKFGPAVAALVEQLTDVSTSADGNRAARKAMDRAHLAAASLTPRRSSWRI